MTKEELKIVFMGTPAFASESLKALVEGGYNVVGVVTTPDKPSGRHGSILQASAVKQYAISHDIPVLQPEKLKNEDFIEQLKSMNPDLQIVVAFRMLPEAVWNMPRFGTFNLHASLLPQYRGAAPINRAIINGEKETGVTTFFIDHNIDTGKIIRQERIPITETDNAGTIHDILMTTGAKLVTQTVDLLLINDGVIESFSQDALYSGNETLHQAPKIFNEDCQIDWTQPATRIYNFIRGLAPYPAAWTYLINADGSRLQLKIFETAKIIECHTYKHGTIVTDGKNHLDIAVCDGFIRIMSLQLSGKKRMGIKDFLNGMKIDCKFRLE